MWHPSCRVQDGELVLLFHFRHQHGADLDFGMTLHGMVGLGSEPGRKSS